MIVLIFLLWVWRQLTGTVSRWHAADEDDALSDIQWAVRTFCAKCERCCWSERHQTLKSRRCGRDGLFRPVRPLQWYRFRRMSGATAQSRLPQPGVADRCHNRCEAETPARDLAHPPCAIATSQKPLIGAPPGMLRLLPRAVFVLSALPNRHWVIDDRGLG